MSDKTLKEAAEKMLELWDMMEIAPHPSADPATLSQSFDKLRAALADSADEEIHIGQHLPIFGSGDIPYPIPSADAPEGPWTIHSSPDDGWTLCYETMRWTFWKDHGMTLAVLEHFRNELNRLDAQQAER